MYRLHTAHTHVSSRLRSRCSKQSALTVHTVRVWPLAWRRSRGRSTQLFEPISKHSTTHTEKIPNPHRFRHAREHTHTQRITGRTRPTHKQGESTASHNRSARTPTGPKQCGARVTGVAHPRVIFTSASKYRSRTTLFTSQAGTRILIRVDAHAFGASLTIDMVCSPTPAHPPARAHLARLRAAAPTALSVARAASPWKTTNLAVSHSTFGAADVLATHIDWHCGPHDLVFV